MPEQPFTVITLAPDDGEILSADEVLANLEADLSVTIASDDLVVEEPQPTPLGRSWAFDFTDRGGRFVRQGSKGPLTVRNLDTLVGWMEKCLMTARESHPIHPPGYGMEQPFQGVGRRLDTDTTLGERVREALTFNERIADVRDVIVESDPNDDYQAVGFTVVLDDGTVLPLRNVRIL